MLDWIIDSSINFGPDAFYWKVLVIEKIIPSRHSQANKILYEWVQDFFKTFIISNFVYE